MHRSYVITESVIEANDKLFPNSEWEGRQSAIDSQARLAGTFQAQDFQVSVFVLHDKVHAPDREQGFADNLVRWINNELDGIEDGGR